MLKDHEQKLLKLKEEKAKAAEECEKLKHDKNSKKLRSGFDEMYKKCKHCLTQH